MLLRQEIELGGAADRRPTAVHPELRVEVLRVGPDRVEGHREVARDFGAVQLGSEQPEDIELAFTQRLD